MGKIIITIILVKIEITIIQTVIFEFENMSFSMPPPKKRCNLELRKNKQNGQKENVPI